MDNTLKNHYSLGTLKDKIITEKDIESAKKDGFCSFDGFHSRGKKALIEICEMAGFDKNHKILDAGCGTGGSSRFINLKYGSFVTGLDLSFDYTNTADKVSKLCSFDKPPFFINASACFLPFMDNVFDFVLTEHMQMNLLDKRTFLGECFRVLKKNSEIVFHEVVKKDESDLYYPLPWAEDVSMSFLITKDEFIENLEVCGFKKIDILDKSKESLLFFEKAVKFNLNSHNKPAGLSRVMGSTYLDKLMNMKKNLEDGRMEIIMGKAAAG